MVVEAVSRGCIVHVVGAGHSAMVAEEMFYRAGGLACVNPIIDTDITVAHGALRSTLLEHVEGYARALLKSARVAQGDVVIVVSTSGVNTFPVEAAIAAREMGAKTIGITSLEYSKSLEPRNRFGKRLYEVVDVYIDNKVPRGDAAIEIAEGIRVAPVSTILNSFIVNALVARATQKMLEAGIEPAIWLSSHLPGAEQHNERLFKLFGNRIKLL
jgi:uncharacterized phosphosugar-binding protein